ncbi:phage tail tape measure protein [Pseudonocardia sp. D17]|uniref:aggregation-promoting factor C-terminal-like domain-containing protein n=1 Tax=Pseudonocardia sp. D17 TaxID=882661 RepID=UPI002B39EA1F|nr:hypothetical protein PSD17_55520 [Pseudonocardia sp. D17]
MSTYTAGDIAVPMVPSMDGFFEEITGRLQRFEPPEVRIRPDVDTDEAENKLSSGGLVAAGAAVGLLIGAAITKGLADAIDFSSAQGKLQAQMGLSAQDSARFGKIAGDLYSGAYGDSLEGVNDALRSVMQSGALAADATDAQIQNVTGSVLNLSTAFGVDATDAANALGQMMRTGLAPDAQTALDVIYRGFQLGDDKAGDFLDTLNEYGTQFRKLGLNAADATGLISQGLQAGARDSDLVADSIKEFSIRAVDGSKTTADGFAAIGLNAGQMAERIGAGGDVAKVALAQVLDGLRGIKDPAQQSQAAVALFGTQAEDLGAALFALHPETAAAGLGQIGGAADQAGQALQTPASRMESFQRTLQTTIVDLIGGKVLPIFSTLIDWGKKIFDWGPVPDILSFLATTGGTAVAVLLAVVGATKAWTIAQAAFNAVMALNPVTLIIVAIAAFVGAIIWAYNNVEWFRDFVQGAFKLIGDAASWLWNNAIKPAFDAIAAVAVWLWQNVLQPAFNGIATAVRVAGDIIGAVFGFIIDAATFMVQLLLAVVIGPLVLAWQALGVAWNFVYANVIKPVFDFFAAVAQWLWVTILQPIFALIAAAWNVLATGFRIIYDSVLAPVFQAVATIAGWVWNNILAPIFSAIGTAWNALGTGLRWVYDNIIKPVFDIFAAAVQTFHDVFSRIVDGIKAVWNGIIDAFKKPVKFVLETIWNGGVGKLWNAAKTVFPLGDFPAADVSGFALGGIAPGYEPGVDRIPALVAPGEVMLRPEVGRGMGRRWVDQVNLVARRGGPGAVSRFLAFGGEGPQEFADGGIAEGQSWAKAQRGKPYVWGGVGPGGYDCSGMVSALTRVVLGLPQPYIRMFATGSFAANRGAGGFVPGKNSAFVIGVSPNTGQGIGHMAANLDGLAIESRGGDGVVVGPDARSVEDSLFPWQFYMPRVGDKFVPAGSGQAPSYVSLLQRVFDPIAADIRSLVNTVFPRPSGTMVGDVPGKMTDWAIDKAHDYLFGKAGEMDAGRIAAGMASTAGDAREAVRAVATKYGWDHGTQWNALEELIRRESGWDPLAKNPNSTAYGLFQFLDATWAAYGGHKTSNPGLQAQYGLTYIADKYQTPYGALSFWNRNHWYDQGGELPPGATTVFNGLPHSETVLPLPPKLVDNLLARGGDGAELHLHAREPMSQSEISRLADEVVRKTQWARRTG